MTCLRIGSGRTLHLARQRAGGRWVAACGANNGLASGRPIELVEAPTFTCNRCTWAR